MPANAKTMKNSATWIAARYSIALRPIVPASRPRHPRAASSSMSCGRRMVWSAASLADSTARSATRSSSIPSSSQVMAFTTVGGRCPPTPRVSFYLIA